MSPVEREDDGEDEMVVSCSWSFGCLLSSAPGAPQYRGMSLQARRLSVTVHFPFCFRGIEGQTVDMTGTCTYVSVIHIYAYVVTVGTGDNIQCRAKTLCRKLLSMLLEGGLWTCGVEWLCWAGVRMSPYGGWLATLGIVKLIISRFGGNFSTLSWGIPAKTVPL